MIRSILFALSLTVLPSVALSQAAPSPGDGTDLYRVNREVEAMTRDGRWQRLLDEATGDRRTIPSSVPSPQPPTSAQAGLLTLPDLRLACQEESRKRFTGPSRMDPSLYKRVVERRQLYVRNCMDVASTGPALPSSAMSATARLPPPRPVAPR